MYHYYAEIISAIEKNILLTDLLDEAIFSVSNELQKYLDDNIITFHHTLSDCIKIEQSDNKISFQICEHIYTIEKTKVLKKYHANFSAKSNCSSENLMKICVLKELIDAITYRYN